MGTCRRVQLRGRFCFLVVGWFGWVFCFPNLRQLFTFSGDLRTAQWWKSGAGVLKTPDFHQSGSSVFG